MTHIRIDYENLCKSQKYIPADCRNLRFYDNRSKFEIFRSLPDEKS